MKSAITTHNYSGTVGIISPCIGTNSLLIDWFTTLYKQETYTQEGFVSDYIYILHCVDIGSIYSGRSKGIRYFIYTSPINTTQFKDNLDIHIYTDIPFNLYVSSLVVSEEDCKRGIVNYLEERDNV